MPRAVAGGLFLMTFVVAGIFLALDNQPNPHFQERITLQLGTDRRLPPSMWGIFPPSHVVAPKNWAELGIRVPQYLPPHLDRSAIEVRSGPRGAYLVTVGDEFFLTHRPVDDKSDWTLFVPHDWTGPLHIVSRMIDTRVALGIESPGEFARITWSDGRWNYVLFSPVGHSLETLFTIGDSLR